MKKIILAAVLTVSGVSMADDFVCTGEASLNGHKSVTVTLNLKESAAITGRNSHEIFINSGQYVHGKKPSLSFVNGKIHSITQAIARIVPIEAKYQYKTLMTRSADNQFEVYKLSPGAASASSDYIEFDRFNRTANYFLADIFGYSILNCKGK